MSIVLSAEEIFEMAMKIEKSGYAYYSTIADATSNDDLKDLFRFLAGEEQKHYRFFEKLSKEVEDFTISQEDWDQISDYIQATTDSRFFFGEDKAISLAKKTSGVQEAIDVAIGFEKDTLLFFHEIKSVTPPHSQEAAQKIVEEERRHVTLLSEKKKAWASG